ncbi:hypothetical protein ABK040_016732 [Willaertia magna]
MSKKSDKRFLLRSLKRFIYCLAVVVTFATLIFFFYPTPKSSSSLEPTSEQSTPSQAEILLKAEKLSDEAYEYTDIISSDKIIKNPLIEEITSTSDVYPLVSIILPTYNAMDYLPQSIKSVQAINYPNFELIIVNDASTDNTKEFLSEEPSIKKDSRIKVVHHKINQKLPGALNTGFQLAKGSLLTWISSDNNCTKQFLSLLVNIYQRFPEAGFVYSDHYLFDDKGKIIKPGAFSLYNLDGYTVDNEGIYRAGGARYSPKQTLGGNGGVAAFLYSKFVMKEVGLYDVSLNGIEDYDYWIRILEKFPLAVHSNKALMFYRLHEKSMTSQMKKTQEERERKWFEKFSERHLNGKAIQFYDQLFSIEWLYPSIPYCVDEKRCKGIAYLDLAQYLYSTRFDFHKQMAVDFQRKGMEELPKFDIVKNRINYGTYLLMSKRFDEAKKEFENILNTNWDEYGEEYLKKDFEDSKLRIDSFITISEKLKEDNEGIILRKLLMKRRMLTPLLLKDEELIKKERLLNRPSSEGDSFVVLSRFFVAYFLDLSQSKLLQDMLLNNPDRKDDIAILLEREFNPMRVYSKVFIISFPLGQQGQIEFKNGIVVVNDFSVILSYDIWDIIYFYNIHHENNPLISKIRHSLKSNAVTVGVFTKDSVRARPEAKEFIGMYFISKPMCNSFIERIGIEGKEERVFCTNEWKDKSSIEYIRDALQSKTLQEKQIYNRGPQVARLCRMIMAKYFLPQTEA